MDLYSQGSDVSKLHDEELDEDPRTSRIALVDELAGKLIFDDPRVFKRLALDRIPSELVKACAKAFKKNKRLRNARRELEEATAFNSSKTLEELAVREEEGQGGYWMFPKFKKRYHESLMDDPLETIFQFIESFQNSSPKQSFRSRYTSRFKPDASVWDIPTTTPNYVLFERSPSLARRGTLWRHALGFCELKSASYKGPKPKNPKAVRPLVCQAADFARSHLSGRPFHLFSVGLLIFGSEFCVAIFDRAGVLFSPIHDMWNDTEIFIRVIRSLTCCLSPIELGHDPTVTILSEPKHKLRIIEIRRLGHSAPEDYPIYIISACGRLWYTIGLPIWTSVTLLGRGTSVWLVQERGVGPLFVLKNTWRNPCQLSESAIYGAVEGYHPALAKFYDGGDVFFLGEDRFISACNLRGAPSVTDSREKDVILHRLILETQGRPIYEYTSEKELLLGMRAALSAHKFLCDQGILHRDISVGNIMLPAKTPSESGAEGFLLDLEFAQVKRDLLTIKTVVSSKRMAGGSRTGPTIRTHTLYGPDLSGADVLRGAAVTGTAQFMAASLLKSIIRDKPITHEPRHDVESFIHVLTYCVMKRALRDSEKFNDVPEGIKSPHVEFQEIFRELYGRKQFRNILLKKEAGAVFVDAESFPYLFTAPMLELFKELHGLFHVWRLRRFFPNVEPLSHDTLFSLLDGAIAKVS
ncbi:hypothetical protein BDN70DRAFT_992011 [Pholiota conissans]|uniref:Fungal-type protein kinase domain-containing protein n=1 Tax=Pholiota conissans TaxID=109636 RepID=A0A9P6D2Q6_9AGAR|nr:hypothetical protein BDN70DRAFT_992011 [Pholiota conissans]